jgi:hypothetical protein
MAAQFDGDNLIITLDAPTASVLNQTAEQVYDDAKQWHLNANNRKYPFPFATSGGEVITTVTLAGQYYFLLNDIGWRIISTDESQNVFWDGNLIPSDLTLPIINETPGRTVLHLGLQPLVTGISGLTDDIGQKVDDIHGQTLREIWVDETFPTNGNFGYQQAPFNVWSDAVDYAEGPANLTTMVTLTDATFDRNLKNFTIRGLGFPVVDLNGQDVDKTSVSGVTITGIHLGQLLVQDAGVQSVSGELLAQRVAMAGVYLVRAGSFSIMTSVAVLIPGLPWTLDLGVSDAPSVVGLADVSGGVILDNIEAGDVVHIHMAQGAVTINASCTGGNIVLTGGFQLTDNSTGSVVNTNAKFSELIFARVMENGETFGDQTKLMRAAAAGIIVQLIDGSYVIKSADGLINRITGDDAANGGRSISAVDPS